MVPRFLLLLVLLVPLPAWAHALDVGYLKVQTQGENLGAVLDLSVEVALAASHLRIDEIAPDAIAHHADALAGATLGSGPLTIDGQACTWESAQAAVSGTRLRVRAYARCPAPPGELRWRLAFLELAPPSLRILGRAAIDGHESELVLDRTRDTVDLRGAQHASIFAFVLMGVRHIGAWPSEWRSASGRFQLPDGIDHILFLLALLLAGGSVLEMLRTVTGFTLGHSVTLALAALGLVHLPSRLVESAIALSIAFVAAEDLLVARPRHRWRIAMIFGLVHGFGFASALSGLELSRGGLVQALVGFNVGVEIGQALIVAALAPIVFGARRLPRLERYGTRAAALSILVAGATWFVRRAFL